MAGSEALTSVQPRMRGEHSSGLAWDATSDGSAPHARGTRSTKAKRLCCSRFSPACAGNTGSSGSGGTITTVQPRMRGEHIPDDDLFYTVNGSAPHARGTHRFAKFIVPPTRFSPACAGNTLSTTRMCITGTVQPRMRGEHNRRKKKTLVESGSAPHARGTLLL